MGHSTDGYWLRDGDWFFNWDTQIGENNLLDLANDPRSDNNLADALPERITDYRQRVAAWERGLNH